MQDLQKTIDAAWEQRTSFSPTSAPAGVREAVEQVIALLDSGKLRSAEKVGGEWKTNDWAKKAVLLSFRLYDNAVMPAGGAVQDYDKGPTKLASSPAPDFAASGVRVVPPAVARRGSYIARNVVMMPS